MAELLYPAGNQYDAQRQRQALHRAQSRAFNDKSSGKIGNKYDQPPSVVPLSEEAFNRVILDGDNYKRMMRSTGLNPTVIEAMEKFGHFEDRESWMPTPKQESVIPLGEELYKRIMSGDLDAPNIFNNQGEMPKDNLQESLPNPSDIQKPKGRQSAFRAMLKQSQPSPQGSGKMPANFGRMTKNVLMNRQQPMPQQMPQQRPNIYNNLGPGNQQMQQRPLTAINPYMMGGGF